MTTTHEGSGNSVGIDHGADYGATVEQACEVMHDAYEAAAISAGWETQERSRRPWADVPAENKATMRVAVGALWGWLETRPAAGRDVPDALAQEHWLRFDASKKRGRVTGCQCGFTADIESDYGWGDSVVRHLFEVALARVTSPAETCA